MVLSELKKKLKFINAAVKAVYDTFQVSILNIRLEVLIEGEYENKDIQGLVLNTLSFNNEVYNYDIDIEYLGDSKFNVIIAVFRELASYKEERAFSISLLITNDDIEVSIVGDYLTTKYNEFIYLIYFLKGVEYCYK